VIPFVLWILRIIRSALGRVGSAYRKRRVWQITSTVLNNAYLPASIGLTVYRGFLYLPNLARITIYQGPLKGVCTPTLNCYACPGALMSCPIGSLQHFAIRHQFPFFLVGFFGLVGVGVGRMTCGWLCPFGFLQDLLKKVSRRVVRLPRWMGNLKYASLVVIAILLPFFLGELWFSKLCPAGAVEAAIPWAVAGGGESPELGGLDVSSMIGTFFWIKMAIAAVFIVAMIFVKRPFCRTACPLGAIFSLFNRLSLVKLRVDYDLCTNCGLCQQMCPVDLKVHMEVDSPECIKCFECTKCPTGAIKATFGLGGR
jgi:ferredoxin-type protein NapH